MRKTILVIEDDELLRKAYGAKFSREGYGMIEAGGGDEGVEAAKNMRPDIIILDMLLGEVNGVAVLERLKADKSTRAIPVMVLTNSSTPETAAHVLKLGAASYHVKAHVSMDDIMNEVRLLIGG